MTNSYARKATYVFSAGLVGLLTFAAAPALASSDPTAAAVESLQSGKVYVAPGASAGNLEVYNGTEVGVVVLPAEDFTTFSATDLANIIYPKVSDDYETVIVVNSDPSTPNPYGVAPSAVSEQVWAVIGDNNSSSDSAVDALAADSSELIALTAAQVSPDSTPPSAVDAGTIVGVGGGLLLGVGAVVASVMIFNRRRSSIKVRGITSRAVRSSELRNAMERFAELTRIHIERHLPTHSTMSSVLLHLNDLFIRLDKKGVESSKQIAEVNYRDILQKMNSTLGEDYYLDIVQNKNLWDNALVRTREVEQALGAVDDELVNNIRQVNASKDLEFRVALETLLSSVDRPNASDMIR